MKTLLYLGSIVSGVSTYGTNLMKICCLIITVFLGLSACEGRTPQSKVLTNIKIASVSVDASYVNWPGRLANERAYVSKPKFEKALASAVQRRVSPLAQGSRAVEVYVKVGDLTFNVQGHPIDAFTSPMFGPPGPVRLHSRIIGSLTIIDSQSGEILRDHRIFTSEIIHENKWPIPEDIQWSENEVNKNLGELAMGLADEVACSMFHVSCTFL